MNLLDLAAVHAAIRDLDEEAILQVASDAATSVAGGWFARARAIGELQRRARYKSAAVTTYAKRLKMSPSTAYDLGAIDRDILLPRLRDRGEDARFPIQQRQFYSLAVRLAPEARKSALAIIRLAEAARRQNPRFSTLDLRELIGVPARSKSRGVEQALSTLGGLSADARARFVRTAKDPAQMLRAAEATVETAQRIAAELRAATEAP